MVILQGSEAAYIYGCIILCSIPLLLACAAYGVVKLMNSRRRKMKQIREELNNNQGPGRKQGSIDCRYSVMPRYKVKKGLVEEDLQTFLRASIACLGSSTTEKFS